MSQPPTRLQDTLGPWWQRTQQALVVRAQQAQKRLTPYLRQGQQFFAALLERLRLAWQKPRMRLIISASGIGLLAIIIAGIVVGNYVFGGNDTQAYHGPITAPTLVPNGSGTIFTIQQSSSDASFTIHEVLFGKPKTVIGKTQQVAGQILVDTRQPNHSQLSTIRIDVGTLTTDDPRRNHTLHSRILQTDTAANEFATFVPTSYSGMPASLTSGKPVTFQVHGNLTVHQVTRPETFTVTLKQISATQVIGTATTTVNYADFKLAIPNIPFVSNVGKSVVLGFDFIATPTKAK